MLAKVVKAGDVRAVQRRGPDPVVVLQEQYAADQVAQAAAHEAAVAEAWAEGHAAGAAEGRRSALAEGAHAAVRGADALEALAAAARAAHTEEVQATSRAVLAAALDVAEWVLRHELARDSRSLLTRLGEAAGALLPSPTTRVGVSRADEAAARGWAAGRAGVEVFVDPALSPGDASLDTDAGSVEVSVAAALRIAAETLGVDPARGVQ